MRFACPSCRFEEREETGLTPVAVNCPQCGSAWAAAAGRWVPHVERLAPARQRPRASRLEAGVPAVTMFGRRIARA